MRYRFVETDEPRSRIAADYGISDMTLYRLAERHQWRRDRPPIDVPATRKSIIAAEAAAQADTQADAEEIQSRTDELAQLPLADRLQRAVEMELSAVELYQMAPRTNSLAQSESERITRTLERLTATLSRVYRLRTSDAPKNGAVWPYDIPEDIDEFRNELARRIEALVDSRSGEIPEPTESDKPHPDK